MAVTAPSTRPKILIGFAESLAAIESAWSLIEAGFDVVAFTRAGKRMPPLAASRSVKIVTVPSPEHDTVSTVSALRELLRSHEYAAVLPLDDASVWLCDQFSSDQLAGAALAGPLGDQARLALDKREQLELATRTGFLVPPTSTMDASTVPLEAAVGAPAAPAQNPATAPLDLDRPLPELPGSGPWMVKCALAIVERGGKFLRPAGAIARTPAEVSTVASGIKAPTLIQPVIDGVGEGVFGFAYHGETMALSAHRRVRMMNPRGSGSSACRSIPVDPALAEPVRRFIAESGWHGIFMIELLRDSAGRPWFMELNGRAWGSMALARRRGLEYPAWAVQAALDPAWRPAPPPEAPHIVARHAGREIVHLLAVMRGARGADAGRWPRRGATLTAMLRPRRGTRWYNRRRGELRVFLRDTWRTVAGQISGRG
jgi:hypothetical protein